MESSGSMAIQASISFAAVALSSFQGCAVTVAAWAAPAVGADADHEAAGGGGGGEDEVAAAER